MIRHLQSPFTNGVNKVLECGSDFAGNESCVTRDIRVDNEASRLSFAENEPEDPELIRVSAQDEFSGVESGTIYFRQVGMTDWRPLLTQELPGELRARVDSAAETPGTYEFMATATDVAGNFSETVLREDGTTMTLQFPLRSGVELNAHIEPGGSKRTTVAYGKSARVQGRLFDASGQPLAGKPVVVDEDFGEGALIDHRVRTVVTDEAGRWSSKLPAGPTRSVSAEYAGDQRYLDTTVAAGRLAVKTGARLGLTRRHVPEGRGTTSKAGSGGWERGFQPGASCFRFSIRIRPRAGGRRCEIPSGRSPTDDFDSSTGSGRTTSKMSGSDSG